MIEGFLPESPEDAFGLFLQEDDDADTPKDCHRHCACWETDGECCECGQIRTPIHTPKEEYDDIPPSLAVGLAKLNSLGGNVHEWGV